MMQRLLGCLLASLPALAAQPVRTLILSGHNNHEWRQTTPYLQRVLDTTGRFETRVMDEPAGMTAAILSNYDVVVSNYCGPRWGAVAEKALESFVRRGGGFAVVHAASYPFGVREVLGEHMTNTGKREAPWVEYARMVGASWSEDPKTGHGDRHVYQVTWTNADHPIARGLPRTFLISDELYHRFKLEPGIQVLATAFDDAKRRGTGKDEPLLWTVQYGQGRVFHTALGHDLDSMGAPGFMASFARGTEWAATGAVTLPAELPPHPLDARPVRVLAVTGGHDHEASFYSIFEGYRDMVVNVDPHPVAFRRNLVKAYDVIVLYDMIQELPEAQKKNLREFVESGKGLVALHHSIASFHDWEWWKDVIGGHYYEKAMGDHPASSYLHDVWQKAWPVAQHPITKGIPEIQIKDETYKGMWISPEAQILVRTDAPTSDGPLAWVSPYAKSKVVYVQLGHGREAHESPAYRRLVHQSILWTAGR